MSMNLKKIILLSILGIVIIGLGYIAYTMFTTRSHSPADRVEYNDGDFKLSIDYCRPFKKGRVIFGEKTDGALVPFGQYWRTGANDATEIEFNSDVFVNGEQLGAGTYRLYTIPNKDSWVVAFNSETGKWGYSDPDYNLDVLRIEIASEGIDHMVEQFTISSDQTSETTLNIILEWDQTRIKIPVNY